MKLDFTRLIDVRADVQVLYTEFKAQVGEGKFTDVYFGLLE